MKKPAIALVGDHEASHAILGALAESTHLHLAAIYSTGHLYKIDVRRFPQYKGVLNALDPEELAREIANYQGHLAVAFGSVREPKEGNPRDELSSRDGRYVSMSKALQDAGLDIANLADYLPNHRIPGGVIFGREPEEDEMQVVRQVQAEADHSEMHYNLIIFDLAKAKVRRLFGDPVKALPKSNTRKAGQYLYLKGAADHDGLSGCPIVPKSFLDAAASGGYAGLFLETRKSAAIALRDGMTDLQSLSSAVHRRGHELARPFFVYGL